MSRKEELEKAKKSGEDITQKNKINNPLKKTEKEDNSPWTLTKEDFEKERENKDKKEQSLVAQKFGEKKDKTWNDVKSENGDDPEKIKDWLNNNPDYKAGSLTKKGMAEYGYSQGEDGKWSNTTTSDTTSTTTTNTDTNATTDGVLDGLDKLTAEDETVKQELDSFTNPETGDVDTEKAKSAMEQYEQKLVESGAAFYDKDGNFTFVDTNKKGWETWATLLSVGISAVGLAMGVPIMPINFKAITGKDAKDAKARALQQQYLNIMSDDAAKVSGMNADVEAGKVVQENEEALNALSKYRQDTAATKDVLEAQTDASKQLIDAQTEADMKKAQQQISANEHILALENKYSQEMTKLSDKLSTASAKELTSYSKSGWLIDYIKEARAEGLNNKDIALAVAGLGGQTPTQKGLQNAESIVGMVTSTVNAAGSIIGKGGNKGD